MNWSFKRSASSLSPTSSIRLSQKCLATNTTTPSSSSSIWLSLLLHCCFLSRVAICVTIASSRPTQRYSITNYPKVNYQWDNFLLEQFLRPRNFYILAYDKINENILQLYISKFYCSHHVHFNEHNVQLLQMFNCLCKKLIICFVS